MSETEVTELLTRYLELRREKLMGQLWIEGNVWYYSPLGTPHGFNGRVAISRGDFKALVTLAERKPVRSETLIWGIKYGA